MAVLLAGWMLQPAVVARTVHARQEIPIISPAGGGPAAGPFRREPSPPDRWGPVPESARGEGGGACGGRARRRRSGPGPPGGLPLYWRAVLHVPVEPP